MKYLSTTSILLLFRVALVQSEALTPKGTEPTGLDGSLALPTDGMFDDTDDVFDVLVEQRMRNLKSDSGSSSSSSSSSDDNGYNRYSYNGNYNAYNGYNGYNQYSGGSTPSYSNGSSSSSSGYNNGGTYNSATGMYNDYSTSRSSYSSSSSTEVPWQTYTLVACGFALLIAGAMYGPIVKKRMIQKALELDEGEKQRKRAARPSSSKHKPKEPLFKRPSRKKDYYDEETTVTSGQDDYTEMGDNFGAVTPYHGPPPVYHQDQYYPAGPYDTGNGSQYFTDAPDHYDGGEQYYGDNYNVDNQYYHQDNGMPDYPGYR